MRIGRRRPDECRSGAPFVYRAEIDTPTVFQVQPSDGRGVRILHEKWSTPPEGAVRRYRDLYGNPCRYVFGYLPQIDVHPN